MTTPAHAAQALFQLPSSAFDEPALVNPGPAIDRPGQSVANGLPTKGSITLMEALKELDAAQDQYLKANLFYDGEVGDIFATPNVQRLLSQAGVNDVEDFNYAKVPVDAIVDKLQVRAVTVAAGDEANTDDETDEGSDSPDGGTTDEDSRKKIAKAAEEKIDELRKRNQLDAEESELHLLASKHGEAYLFVWPVIADPADDDLDDELEPGSVFDGAVQLDEEHQGRVVGVDMFVNSAEVVRMFYDPENPLKATHVIKSWDWVDPDADEVRRRATLYFKKRVERWVTKPGGDPAKAEDWIPYLPYEDSTWPEENPTGVIPFFHFRTGRVYGKPEHLSAYGPQRLINKLISAHAVTIDYQSFPQRYALLNPKSDDVLQNMIDPDFPEDDDDDPEGGGTSVLRADPSAVWKLPGVSGVGQFEPADPSVFMTPLDRYIKSMAELTGTPLNRFTGYSDPPSGEALRVANGPHNDKVRAREKSYGATWADAYEFALELLKITDVTVQVQWMPVEIAEGLDDWNVVAAKIANGVPVKQALMEAGYPQDEVEKWLMDESGADLVRRVALLNSIGTAVQTIGAGVAMGVVSAPQVGDIVSRILGLTAEDLPLLDEPVELQPVDAAALAAQQMAQRGQQVAEHQVQNPAAPPPGPDGKSVPAPQTKPLPKPPPPPKPVKVGA